MKTDGKSLLRSILVCMKVSCEVVPKVTKETLLELYNEKRFTMSKIAEDLGVGTSTIHRGGAAFNAV